MSNGDLDLETRLQHLEDREQVWQLLMDYRTCLDRRDFGAYASLFTEDGEWTGTLGRAVGRGAIETLLVNSLEVYEDDTTRTYHLIANPVIIVDGNNATATSMWCFITRDDTDDPVLSLVGHYHDQIVRDGDRWRFRRREAVTDVPYKQRRQT
jgi:uncharacterized protein (TIGR02246 family)